MDVQKKSNGGLSLFTRWIDMTADTAGKISAFCLLIMALIICYAVLMRYIFQSPPFWASGISVYLCIAVGFIGASYTLKNNAHFAITLVVERLTPKKRRMLQIVTNMIGIIFCVIFVWKGSSMVIFSYTFGDLSEGLLEVPLWIPNLLVPIGGFLLLLQFLKRLVHDLTGEISSNT